jgi:NADPH:quinone reductase
MQVIEVAEFGGPEVLTATRAADPTPGPGEVVVATSFADVLFLDVVIRRGLAVDFFAVRPPYVPGNGVSGRVAAAGDGVHGLSPGRPVIAHTGGSGGTGGYAERAVVRAADVVAVPDGVGLAAAAALLHDGATALGLMEGTGISAGETVLVVGAAGGLGILLVQYAAAAGARVVAAARGSAKRELALRMGAEAAVDYGDPGWPGHAVAASGGGGPQVVFDGVGGQLGAAAFGITADGGRFSAHGAPGGGFAPIDPAEAARRGITVRGIEQVQLQAGGRARLAAQALDDAAAGRITPVIGQTFPLGQASGAHRAIEGRRVTGKTLLEVR